MILRPTVNGYALLEDYVYRDIIVPKGYITDGISYKFRFIGVFINKYDKRVFDRKYSDLNIEV